MTRAKLLLGTLFLTSLLVRPAAGWAQTNPSFLPNCEATRIVLQKNQEPEITKSPDEYDQLSEADKQLYKVVRVIGNRECKLEDFISLFANAARWGFSILAVVALFFFIWGGFTLLISGGRSNYVNDGKEILKGTFIGVIVVLTSWVIVNFYFVAVTGNRYGNIFPNTSVPPRQGLGGDSGCRAALLKSSQSGCNSRLRVGCSDPVSSDGSVTRLQRALNDKCGCGPVDGCFQDATAWCLWQFKVGNGLKTPKENLYQKTTADATTISLLDTPGVQCISTSVFGDPPEPLEPPAPDEQPPPDEPFCCVSQNARFGCIDLTKTSPLLPSCPIDDPLLSPSQNPRYRLVDHACNDTADTATYNTCFKGSCLRLDTANAIFECADNCLQDDCNEVGAVWKKGSCSSQPFPTEFPLPSSPDPLCTPP